MTESRDFRPPGPFLKHLTERLNLPRTRPIESFAALEIHTLDLSGLKLNFSFYTPFIVHTRVSTLKRVSLSQVQELLPLLRDRARDTTASFVVLVLGGRMDDENEILQLIGQKSVAVISLPTIESVMNAPNRDRAWIALAEPLVQYLGRQTLSPYRPGKPAHAGRFFGRTEALMRATAGGNFTIMGNRRIGKTSLLREIKARLVRNSARLRTADIYGNNFHSTYDIVKEILVHLRPDLVRRLDAQPQLVDSLPAHISQITEKGNEEVAIFIDEVDHILEFDAKQDFKLFNLLRATFEHERCRIFLAGFRRVMQAKVRVDTPLYNFTQSLVLRSLTRLETQEMVTGPFSRLGINISPELLEVIMRESSGLPELVQILCQKVLDYFDAHGEAPNAPELIASMVNDDIFRQTVFTSFLKNTNPVEQLACYGLIAQSNDKFESFDKFQFTLQNIDEVMKNFGFQLRMDQLDLLAENLWIGGVIEYVQASRSRSYRFSVPRLAEYCMADDLDFVIQKTKEELETNPNEMTKIMENE